MLPLLMVTERKAHSWLLLERRSHPRIWVPVKADIHQLRVRSPLAIFLIPSFGDPPFRSMNVPLATLCSLMGCGTGDEHQ